MRKLIIILNAIAVAVLFRAPTAMAGDSNSPAQKETQRFVEQTVLAITRSWNEQELWDRAAPELGQRESPDQIKNDLLVARTNLGAFVKYLWADGKVSDDGVTAAAVYIARGKFEGGDAVFDINLIKHGGNWRVSFFRVQLERSCPPEQHRNPFEPVWTIEAKPRPAEITILAQLDTGEQTLKRGEFRQAMEAFRPAFYNTLYEQFSPSIQYRVDVGYGQAALAMGELRDAHLASVRATAIPNAPRAAWLLRMAAAADLGDYQDAYVAFKGVRDDCTDSYIFTPAQVVTFDLWFGTLPNGPEAQLDFERYLESVRWKSRDPVGVTLDLVHFHYAQNLLAAGDGRKALQIASSITLPDVLAALAADRRFDPAFNNADPGALVAKAADDRLAMFRRMVERDTQSMEARNAVAQELESLGRSDEALEEVTDTLSDAAHLSVADRQRYSFGIQYDRALLLKARLLFDVGRYDEAVETVATAASERRTQPGIDTSLLLAKWLVALGRGAEAMHELSHIPDEKLSLTGRRDAAELRACAASQTGDQIILEESIRFLKEHPSYSLPALMHADLCTNDLDGASDAIVTALNNPRYRVSMLAEIQMYRKPDVVPDFQQMLDDRLAHVRSTPRVMNAINHTGRINTYDILYPGRFY